jgi:hypothetical protein
MDENNESSLPVKIFSLLLGFVTGAIYGLAILLLGSYFFKYHFDFSLILWAAIVFSVVGVFKGNIIFEAFLIMLHFIWGFINGDPRPFQGYDNLRKTEPEDYLRVIMWIGFATALAIYLGNRHYF